MTNPIYLRLIPYILLGGLLAFVYLYALAVNVRLYMHAGSVWSAALLHLARLLAVAAVFTLCARRGAFSLLSSLAGFELTRRFAINQQRIALGGK